MIHRLSVAVLLATSLLLAGCDSSEERAESHFQKGLQHYEAGQQQRAMLEFRNTLQLAPEHEEARLLLAEMQRDRGDLPRAVANYRELIEFHPDNGAAHLALAQISLDLGDWDTAERETTAAEKLLEPSPELAGLRANIDYRKAILDGDRAARAAQVEIARTLIETDPDMLLARRLVIDSLLRDQKWPEALEMVDAGIALAPDNYELYQMRLGTLEELGRDPEITAQLEEMVGLFPDEPAVPETLVRWYVEQGNLDAAETFLRGRAEADPENLDRQTELARFLNEMRGYAAVTAELTRLTEAGGANAPTFRAMRANLMFDNGEHQAAIDDLEALLAGLPEDERTGRFANDVRVDLARMWALSGETDKAKALVAEVLDSDTTQTAALKLRAAWMIEEDDIEDAVVTLRAALRESPRDPQIMTLMAAAHERAGEADLEREMLALAVEASRNAPDESLRYARNLIAAERYLPAEDVLINSLRLNRENAELYGLLGQVYVALADWARAGQVIQVLKQLSEHDGKPETAAMYNALQAQVLAGQQRDEELFTFLDELSESETGLAADVAIIRAHTVRGETAKARERLEQALAKDPDNAVLKFLDASVKAADGQYAEAETELRALLDKTPQAEQIWMALYRLQLVQGNAAGAEEVLAQALESMPDAPALLFARAGELEQAGDYEGAIAIYEALYARNSSNEVVANNLASLLSMYREGDEALDRAYRIGRRLRDSQVPAFRDTYGWIAARKGEYREAVDHLEVAVQAYPNHPVVQYHYAVALAGLGRDAEALKHFQLAETLDTESVLSPDDKAAIAAEIARLEAGDPPASQPADQPAGATEGQ